MRRSLCKSIWKTFLIYRLTTRARQHRERHRKVGDVRGEFKCAAGALTCRVHSQSGETEATAGETGIKVSMSGKEFFAAESTKTREKC